MAKDVLPVKTRALTAAQYDHLSDVPPELEWLANITNKKTRRAYKIDVGEFSAFAGIKESAQLRTVTRAHVIAWRKDMEARELSPASIRRKLSALSSLFDYLCEHNAVAGNPVDGVKRPAANGNEGSTPALGDAQARKLLDAPPPDTLKGVRDRAILATLLYHGIRREELCLLRVRDMQTPPGRAALPHQGQAGQDPVRSGSSDVATPDRRLSGAGRARRGEPEGPLFRPVKNNRTGDARLVISIPAPSIGTS